MPRFSLIIPVFAQPELLAQCLRSVRASAFSDYEILVSDDGSPDAESIRSVAAEHGAGLLRSESRRGSAAARNLAARAATGEHLVFLDSDVTVSEDTLTRFAQAFEQNPLVDAVMGSYDRQPSAPNVTSRFRNLLHAHGHHRSHREATTFWTGCGAMRRERFLLLGGFQEAFERPSIEDVELGLRLHGAGGRILLAPEIQVTHHKAWSFRSMVQTDLVARAIPWAGLIREHGLPRDLNFHLGDRLGAVLTALAVPLLFVALRHGAVYWGLLALTLVAVAGVQISQLRFLAGARGTLFAFRCFPLLLVYNLTCVTGLVAGLFRSESRRDRWLAPAITVLVCLILGLQMAGGAFHAEFNGYPDEAAQLVSGLMVYDYITAWPVENPIKWAERYYLHYPKVAIGHWPPGFHIMEALWWLVFPPSRVSAMLLNAAIALLAAVIFYHLMRAFAPGWLCLCGALLMIATPVVQQSYDLSMADLPCLLWSVLLIDAILRLVRRPSLESSCFVGLWLICALLTKGTGAALVPAPLLALLLAGRWRTILRWRTLAVAVPVLLLGLAWYVAEGVILHHNLRAWGGVTMKLSWPFGNVAGMAGYGFWALGCGGACVAIVRRQPAAVASAAIVFSTVGVSFFLRAMNEPRHFIILLPGLLLLSVYFLAWLEQRNRFWLVLGVPALALFPFTLYRQQPEGFTALLSQIHRPARMLVSSTGIGEGAWIAEVALAEKRPGSMVARASKTLSRSGWNGERYRLTTKTAGEIELRLDQADIETAIVQTEPGQEGPAHHPLLERTLQESASWRPCGSAGTLTAYCRVKPPSVPRQPLIIDLGDNFGAIIDEDKVE